MKRPILPVEEQLTNPTTEASSKTGEPSKRKPKLVVHQGIPAHRTGETDKKAFAMPEAKPASDFAAGSPDLAALVSAHERLYDATSEAPVPAEGQSVQPVRRPDQESQPGLRKDINPGRRLHAFEAAAKNSSRAKVPWHYRLRPTREKTHRAYWDVTSTLSLIINVILIVVLVVMAQQIKNLKTTLNTVNNFANNVLGGLYGNFVQMDQASINTTINVDAQIPLNISIPVSQYTDVVLTRDVEIPGAQVVINTGVLNINAPANVTLPAGTALAIALNMDIPVQTSIPISLQVPVHIPLNQTELHQPFTGLQSSLRPLYCALNKNAQYPAGTYICAEQNVPTPSIP